MRHTGGQATDRLPTGWIIAGSLLFAVAIAAPIAVFNTLPTPHLVSAGTSTPPANGDGAGLGVANASDLASASSVTIASDGPTPPGHKPAASPQQSDSDQLGSLGVLIETQQHSNTVDSRTLRRMIIDAVAVDLESTGDVREVREMHVSMRDCDNDKKAIVSDTDAFERTLAGMLGDLPAPVDHIVRFPGITITYCDDLTHVSSVTLEGLGAELNPETAATLVTANDQVVPDEEADEVSVDNTSGDPAVDLSQRAGGDVRNELAVISGKPDRPEIRAAEAPVPNPTTAADGKLADVQGDADATPHVATETPFEPVPHDPGTGIDLAATEAPDAATGVSHSKQPDVSSGRPSDLVAMRGRAYEMSDALRLDTVERKGSSFPDAIMTVATPLVADTETLRIGVLPHHANSADAEIRLSLTSRARRTAQLRLTLLGYDPRGVDGIFGPATRTAIATLQEREALPRTGYLDPETLTILERKSRTVYRTWQKRRQQRQQRERARRRDIALAKTAPAVIPTTPAARRATACVRDSRGVIISNQSFRCDLSVLRESLDELFASPDKT